VRAALDLSPSRGVTVLSVSSRTGEGIDRLWQEVVKRPLRRDDRQTDARELLKVAQQSLASRFDEALASGDRHVTDLVGRWQRREIAAGAAAVALIQLLSESNNATPQRREGRR
jgi:hypothetical protein